MYDEAKNANYPLDELLMVFYFMMMRTLTRRGDFIFMCPQQLQTSITPTCGL